MDNSPSLTHYGVKGMKWGRRKVYLDKVDKRIARFDRVASGKGSLRDKATTLVGSSTTQLLLNRSLKGTAAKRSVKDKEHRARVAAGKPKAEDIVRRTASLNLIDLVKSGQDKNRKS